MIVNQSKSVGQKRILTQQLIISRIYITLSLLFVTLAFLLEPQSVPGRSAIVSLVPLTWVYSLLFLCILSLIDIIINDIIDDKYSVSILIDYRHILYMMMSLMTFSISMSIVNTFGISFLLMRIWLDALIAVLIAFLDVLGRYRNNRG